jgi:hypothetical protein
MAIKDKQAARHQRYQRQAFDPEARYDPSDERIEISICK